jgi:hypothetical protein
MTHLQTSYLWILKFEFKFLNQTQSNRGRFELNTGTDALDRTHAPGVSRRGVTRHLGVRVLPIPPDRRILRPPSSFGARGPSKLGDAFLHALAPASAVARPPPCRPPATPCAGLPRLLSLFTPPPFLRGELTRPHGLARAYKNHPLLLPRAHAPPPTHHCHRRRGEHHPPPVPAVDQAFQHLP